MEEAFLFDSFWKLFYASNMLVDLKKVLKEYGFFRFRAIMKFYYTTTKLADERAMQLHGSKFLHAL